MQLARLARVLEPEIMDDPDEARDYDAMDHVAVNGRFCEDLLAFAPAAALHKTLDVGTGTARIPIELCKRSAAARVVGVDLADSMLAIAERNVERAALSGVVSIERADAKQLPFADGAFGCVASNSILHHIPEPADALREMLRVLAPGGVLFVRDLIRPADDAGVGALVALYAANDTARQRALFDASLRASLTPDELGDIVVRLRLPRATVRVTSDRHWTLAHVKPS